MNLPQGFIDEMTALFGQESEALCRVIAQGEPVVSVRVNPARGARLPAHAQPVPWCPTGFYCTERPAFTFDPLWHAGHYYVQDASSMFIHHIISQLVHEPVSYLDLCAAPGGKTTAALSALPPESLTVANEVVPARARVLAHNIQRWGHTHAVVTSADPAWWGRQCKEAFDVVAADVPCSGEGMMRKDAEAVAQWSPHLVQQCAGRQRAILADVWPALRPGGLLIYSTCTYNRQENELMAEYIARQLGADPVPVPTAPHWDIHGAVRSALPAYRFLPHRVLGEGLFVTVLRKHGDSQRRIPTAKGKKNPAEKAGGGSDALRQARGWLSHPDRFAWLTRGDTISAVPRQWQALIGALGDRLLLAGTEVASQAGRKTVPSHGLALSTALAPAAFARCEVPYATAIAYLRGESVTVEAPRGYVLITYRGASLGFVNNLGNRANNLYPKPLRVLSTHVPDAAPTVIQP